LGAAVVLASQGSHLPQVALLMGIFGVGAALPVVALAYVSRGAMLKMRGKLMQAGKTGKALLGAIMVVLAVLILSGTDKLIEAWLVDLSPAWLTQLTTRF
jgi:cytochrome c biogenesis protein CcdA